MTEAVLARRSLCLPGAAPRPVRALPPIVAALALGAAYFGWQAPVAAQIRPAPRPVSVPFPTPGSPIPGVLPARSPSVSATGVKLDPLHDGEVPNIAVPVDSVAIKGATLFAGQLEPMTAGLIGPATPLPRINAVRQRIVQHYRENGYIYGTRVDLAVDKASKSVTFTVIEGHIADVRPDKDIGPPGKMAMRFLNQLKDGRPINSARLEKFVLLAQDVPGVKLSTVLEGSDDGSGDLTLIAQLDFSPVSGLLAADNRAFDQTGPNQIIGVLDINSLTAWGDRTEVSLFHAFPNSQNFGQISTEFFLGASGLKAKIYGGAGVVNPAGPLGELGYEGTTQIFGAQLSYPVIRARRETLYVSASLDALESHVTTTLQGQQSADEVRVVRVWEDYTVSDNFLGDKFPASNQLMVRLSKGLEWLGGYHGLSLPPSTARANEQHNFTAIKFDTSRTQTLFEPWSGASVAIAGILTGQWSNDILPPAEQFYLGGSRYTRGYFSGQVPGDKALAATVELQLNTTANLSSVGGRGDVFSQYYIFYDWGETWQNQSADRAARVASAGGGVRLQITEHAELDLEALGRLNKRPPPLLNDLNGIGLYWRIVGRF